MKHDSDAAVLICLDWRLFQTNKILDQIKEAANVRDFDLVSLAGATKNIVDKTSRDFVLGQIGLCQRLHHSKKVILTNHTDCGAYGTAGTGEKLIADLKTGREIVLNALPNSEVIMILIRVVAGETMWETSCEVVN